MKIPVVHHGPWLIDNQTVLPVILSQGSHEFNPSCTSFYALMLSKREWIKSVDVFSHVKIFLPNICAE